MVRWIMDLPLPMNLREKNNYAFNWRNLIIWVIGFMLYRLLMRVDLPVGNTLPDMVITIVICVIVGKVVGEKSTEK